MPPPLKREAPGFSRGEDVTIRGVLLDYSGTLVTEPWVDSDRMLLVLFEREGLRITCPPSGESEHYGARYWTEHFSTRPRGQRWTLAIRTECTLALMDHFGAEGGREKVAEEVARNLEMHFHPETYPEVPAALGALRARSLRLGLVSQNLSPSEDLRKELDRRGIGQHFDMALTSESAGYDKPDPRLYREACRLLGLAPGEVCHVGNSLTHDARPAREAGLLALLLDRGGRLRPGEGIPVITSLTGILPALSRQGVGSV